jgi:hypothetical protein
MCVNHGRNGVRRVVKAVDELETERDEQRDAEQQEGQRRPRLHAARAHVDVDAVGDEEQSESNGCPTLRYLEALSQPLTLELGPLRVNTIRRPRPIRSSAASYLVTAWAWTAWPLILVEVSKSWWRRVAARRSSSMTIA